MGLGFTFAHHSKSPLARIARAAVPAILTLTLFAATFAAHAADDDGEWEVAPPLYTSQPPRPAPRDDAPATPYKQPGIRYKQPPLRSERPVRNAPTTLFSPLRDGFMHWECDRANRRDILSMRNQWGKCQNLDTRHGRDMSTINPSFAKHIDKHLYACIARAAERAGLPTPARVEIGNMSALRPGDHGRHKYHGRGRALDIGRVRLFDASNRPISTGIRPIRGDRNLHLEPGDIMLHEQYYIRDRTTQKFYDSFRRCWEGTVRGCGGVGTIGCDASPGAKAPRHHDHIHIELPGNCGR